MVRQSEQVRQQQDLLRNATSQPVTSDVNSVTSHKHTAVKKAPLQKSQKKVSQGQCQPCKWCGRTNKHDRRQCPAHDVVCRKCGKHGHFEKVCRSTTQAVCAVDTPIDTLFLDSLNNSSSVDSWSAEVKVNNKPIKFRIDTGADATCLPVDIFEQLLSTEAFYITLNEKCEF